MMDIQAANTNEAEVRSYVAFAGHTLLAAGSLAEMTALAGRARAGDGTEQILVFDAISGAVVDLDPRAPEWVPETAQARGPGRPKLGVVSREVTLLPRHWEWLATQPGGASVTLRKLVDAARRANRGDDARRLAREAAYRFMVAIAGDLPGFEEAARALFAGRDSMFTDQLADWPADVRDQLHRLAMNAFDAPGEALA
jgi:uncharacterized protein